MAKRMKNPNAAKALEELKLEIAQDLGIENNINTSNDPVNNIFTAGPVGGLMTRRLVEMGEEKLMKEEK
ncbi:alpha/beta-type small acid-soluble spore protein [Tissierella creatinini]|nr:alpha/beta-type small acid-soluble spore protein [Tissierella creatinini]TJX60386.1 alpha/beta-type small acid-soluble spore protein [Soehngenia saccharolytica]